MLIQCKSCNVSFDDSLGKCIVCGGEAIFSKEELVEKCRLLATKWHRSGHKFNTVRHELRTRLPLGDGEIDAILQTVKEKETATRKTEILSSLETFVVVAILVVIGLYAVFLIRDVVSFFQNFGPTPGP